MSIKQSVKEITFVSYFLFYHNSSDSCSSVPFRRLSSASASQSWYVSHVRDIALEVVKEKITEISAVVATCILPVPPTTSLSSILNVSITKFTASDTYEKTPSKFPCFDIIKGVSEKFTACTTPQRIPLMRWISRCLPQRPQRADGGSQTVCLL